MTKRRESGPPEHAGEARDRIEAWLAAVDRAEDFVPVPRFADISPQARADSFFWCDTIFAPGANPHDEGLHARHGYHAATARTLDLIRHEYEAYGLALRVTEGRNFLLVHVDRPGLDLSAANPRRKGEIRRIARALFRHGCHPRGLRVPAALDDGTTFSTDPEADPLLLGCWMHRAEWGVRGGALFFLFYKKAPQRVGFLHGGQWFDDDLRARKA